MAKKTTKKATRTKSKGSVPILPLLSVRVEISAKVMNLIRQHLILLQITDHPLSACDELAYQIGVAIEKEASTVTIRMKDETADATAKKKKGKKR